MKHKPIAAALVAGLLCLVLGSGIACHQTTTQYRLHISSTAGGDVTTPGEGTHTYNASQVVDLVATSEDNYHFINWTGDVGTIANTEDAATTITMNGEYTIQANFGLDMTFIDGVPDASQPPTEDLTTTVPTNYCAPIAMANILEYWSVVVGHSNAYNVTAGLPATTAAEYIGYFMNTNHTGSPDRDNGTTYPAAVGTYASDISPGTFDFVRWDSTHSFPVLPDPSSPGLPAGKLGYDWTLTDDYVTDASPGDFTFYKAEIDAGRPVVVCFKYWNPVDLDIQFLDPETEETINVFAWGDQVSSSQNPLENWNLENGKECIGHAVTGVGYVLDWDPANLGPADYIIVHDNWGSTPENIAIPWAFWNSSHVADPGP